MNLVSTPNIEGNIGSCEVKSTEYAIKKGWIFNEYEVVVNDSCSAKPVAHYQYIDYGGALGTVFIIIFLVIAIGLLIKMMFSK